MTTRPDYLTEMLRDDVTGENAAMWLLLDVATTTEDVFPDTEIKQLIDALMFHARSKRSPGYDLFAYRAAILSIIIHDKQSFEEAAKFFVEEADRQSAEKGTLLLLSRVFERRTTQGVIKCTR